MVQDYSKFSKARKEKKEKGRKEYVELLESIIDSSDIILEILDVRFVEEMRNKEIENKILEKGKKIIYVLNKMDLAKSETINKNLNKLNPSIAVSWKERKNIARLRGFIKQQAKQVKETVDRDRVTVGVIGYPNSGKSSLINLLIGRSSAGTSSEAGFTTSIQKLRLAKGIVLLDSPGVIPQEHYSSHESKKISKHAKLGGRHYSNVKNPDMAVHLIMEDYPRLLENYYGVQAESDAEEFLEKLGKKRNYMKSGGKVDEDRTAREVLKDWQSGKIKI